MLVLRREDNESWFDAAVRLAAKYGLETEVAACYRANIHDKMKTEDAAWEACAEWDVLEFRTQEG